MKTLDPKIKKRSYPSGNLYWIVHCTPPDGKRYQKKHSSIDDAETDRMRLIRKYHGGSINQDMMKDAESAIHILSTTSNTDAQGKSVLDAVKWFVEHYQEKAVEFTISEYIDDFIERKRARRSDKTVKEVKYYLDDVRESYGTRKPSELTWREWKKYLDLKNHYYHRYKVLNHFFGWLANDARDISKLEHPPLESNPLNYIDRPKQKRGKPLICTLEEVKSLIQKASEENCVPWFVWGFFTGMRPEAEMKPFWKNPEFGWRFVDLEERKIIVSEEIEKTGRRTREIKIHDNLMEWIKLFQSDPKKYPMFPTNLRRKFHDVKFAILPEAKARENDIMRHTFISNLSRIELIGEVCYQCATSMSMIRKHYKVLISDKKRVEEFFSIKPGDFGLS